MNTFPKCCCFLFIQSQSDLTPCFFYTHNKNAEEMDKGKDIADVISPEVEESPVSAQRFCVHCCASQMFVFSCRLITCFF